MPLNLVRKLGLHTASLPAIAAHRFMNLELVETRLFTSHVNAQQAYKQKLPTLSLVETEIALELASNGVSVTSLTKLGLDGTDEMFAAGLKLAHGRTRGQRSLPLNDLDAENYRSLVTWGLSPSLVRIARRYFGLPAAYDGPKVAYTPPDGRQAGTRLWHRDREDRRMMKVAIYLNDVTEEGGPLQAIHREVFDGPVNRDFTYPILSHDRLEKRLGRKISDSEITSCTGPAGTVIFMDTARLFHRGKPAISQARHAVFQSYFSRAPRHPFFCERSDLSRSQLRQFAAGLPSEAQDVLFWQKALPRYMRVVPKSLV